MGIVTLPTPVVVAGGALLLLAGYLVGVVAGPDAPARTTAEVESYDTGTKRLCLVGDSVSEQDGADAEGRLCGIWKRAAGAASPDAGDQFRFVSVRTAQPPDAGDGSTTAPEAGGQILIYGDVVD